ncbi:MAG: KH domain-containing protein [Candidatus Pacebacteria bacterium]|nr:KH domain-containing protein [Candidatus Paceibacterota bacterium]
MKKEEMKQQIKKIAEKFFEKIGEKNEILIEAKEENLYLVSLKTEDPQILIGKRGETLFLIQHLLSKVIKQKLQEKVLIDLDINDYKKKKINFLRELAVLVADEVALHKKEKELEPMPAYERRIIHLTLSGRKDVATESRGQEPRRRVVIKPI